MGDIFSLGFRNQEYLPEAGDCLSREGGRGECVPETKCLAGAPKANAALVLKGLLSL